MDLQSLYFLKYVSNPIWYLWTWQVGNTWAGWELHIWKFGPKNMDLLSIKVYQRIYKSSSVMILQIKNNATNGGCLKICLKFNENKIWKNWIC